MLLKTRVTQQYQRIVDQAALTNTVLIKPAEGWLRTMRMAIGMTGSQLARRIGITRASISQAEGNEVSGGITLRTMQNMAEAMGCRFVYAVLPPAGKKAEDLIYAQALKRAKAIASKTDEHMALEGQSLYSDMLEIGRAHV